MTIYIGAGKILKRKKDGSQEEMTRRETKMEASKKQDETKPKEIIPTEFEKFMIECCRLPEPEFREFAKKILIENDFLLQEDNYQSMRDGAYKNIPNLLAIRGNDAKICMVSHTDTVREHGFNRGGKTLKVEPVVVERASMFSNESPKRIIKEKDDKIQIGADDRTGSCLALWIAKNSAYHCAILMTTDEEIGAISADHVSFPELNKFKLLLELDRGHHYNELVVQIGGVKLCDKQMENRLIRISSEIGHKRHSVVGMLTDVVEIKRNGMAKNCVNCTVGYYSAHGCFEYIVVQEAYEALLFAGAIIRDFEMETIDELEGNIMSSSEDENEDEFNNELNDEERDYRNEWYR